MTYRRHAAGSVNAVKIAVASTFIAGGALAMAGQAAAEPAVPYPPAPGDPAATAPPPGQPVVVAAEAPVGPPAPPPAGEPPVPEIENQVYGQGQTPGQFGFLRDIWRATRTGDPVGVLTSSPAGPTGPPAGAGAPPQLPPGFTSYTAPESSTPGKGYPAAPAQPLPEGYIPLNGPPQPGWFDTPPAPEGVPPELIPPTP